MKIIRVANGYITNIELSCGNISKIDVDVNKQPVSFSEEDAIQIKAVLEKYYEDKNVKIEIVIEDFSTNV